MLAILATFVAGSSVYRVSARGTQEVQLSRSSAGSYIKAGGWLCTDAMSAVNMAQMRRSPAWETITRLKGEMPGCAEGGREVSVNLLDNTEIGNVEVTKVGFRGGVGWVLPDDLE